jgi:hypothetical protein
MPRAYSAQRNGVYRRGRPRHHRRRFTFPASSITSTVTVLIPSFVVDDLTPTDTRALVEALDVTPTLLVELLDADETFLADITDDVTSLVMTHNINRTIHGSMTFTVSRQLVWGRQRIRPTLTLTSESLGLSNSWVMGVWCPATPDRQLGETPETYSVTALDKLARLDRPAGRSYSLPAGSDVLVDVERIITVEIGEPHILLDTPTGSTVTTNDMVWPPDANWLKIVNEQLAAIGFRGVDCDRTGWYRSGPYVLPANRPIVWTFDADDELGSVVYPDRVVKVDEVPNSWTFIASNWPTPPVETNGIYTYTNTSDGPSSIDALGGGQLGVRPAAVRSLQAVDQAALVAQGDSIAADARLALTHMTVATGQVPDIWHLSVVEHIDSALGATAKWAVQQWDLDLLSKSFEMKHQWRQL